jgi:predicted  nucleic acid-binding Zn-ribbon protein
MSEIAVVEDNVVIDVDWKKKEEDYQSQIANLRKLNEKLINYSEEKAKKFEHDLQKLQAEKDSIQKRLEKMELDELKAAASGSNKNIEAFKEKYDKGLIFIAHACQNKFHFYK